jgi:hypothetical protein
LRPTLNILGAGMIASILAEARRIMAEQGMEIRGAALRQLDHGLRTTRDGRTRRVRANPAG